MSRLKHVDFVLFTGNAPMMMSEQFQMRDKSRTRAAFKNNAALPLLQSQQCVNAWYTKAT